MSKPTIPYLCGGTFLTLLENAKEQNAELLEVWENETRSSANKHMLAALIAFLDPSFRAPKGKGTVDSVVSDYKKCKTDKGAYLPFNQANTDYLISEFNKRILNNYADELKMADHFVARFLCHESEVLMKWLVQALLTLLEQDQQYEGEKDEFYAFPGGKPLTRQQLLSKDAYCVSTLIFGIWHYIIVNRPNNTWGAETINNWCKLGEKSLLGAHKDLVSDIGKTYSREIKIKSRSFDNYFGENTSDIEDDIKIDNCETDTYKEQANNSSQYESSTNGYRDTSETFSHHDDSAPKVTITKNYANLGSGQIIETNNGIMIFGKQ